ncbi:hypothetical protein DTO002I6_4260 [Penicillium roqueforti]|nr:hypothetical protein DTO002I6_4260 [Penicillium roqueforti]
MHFLLFALCTVLCSRVLGHPYASETTPWISATATSVDLWEDPEPSERHHCNNRLYYIHRYHNRHNHIYNIYFNNIYDIYDRKFHILDIYLYIRDIYIYNIYNHICQLDYQFDYQFEYQFKYQQLHGYNQQHLINHKCINDN